ncbi:hypothetical protein SAMN05216365_1222 [Porphyromonadaceae bacterium NLAE-zl-C104]|nr:hypothetical protein SAMN05216331_1882 [Porphyromonadaceae bacterium KH3R12]SFS83567.1 hypothetical protein SAMN05216365_1222 [Porphyromonadaceae bacterium NLAE-zl-C104]
MTNGQLCIIYSILNLTLNNTSTGRNSYTE